MYPPETAPAVDGVRLTGIDRGTLRATRQHGALKKSRAGVLAAVRFIELETSSACNRRCTWCPTGLGMRPRQQTLMQWALFERIVQDLADGGYTGQISLHGLNEPLQNPRLLEEYAHLRAMLPHASLTCYTNGDLLNRQILLDLGAVGVARVRVTLHPHPGQLDGTPESRQEARLNRFLAKVGVDASDCLDLDSTAGVRRDIQIGQMRVEVTQPNIVEHFNDRGGSVTDQLSLAHLRRSPCDAVKTAIAISYDGTLKMCCNITPDLDEHAPYLLADLTQTPLTEAYAGTLALRWQHLHAVADWTATPICGSCKHRLDPSEIGPALEVEVGLRYDKTLPVGGDAEPSHANGGGRPEEGSDVVASV